MELLFDIETASLCDTEFIEMERSQDVIESKGLHIK